MFKEVFMSLWEDKWLNLALIFIGICITLAICSAVFAIREHIYPTTSQLDKIEQNQIQIIQLLKKGNN